MFLITSARYGDIATNKIQDIDNLSPSLQISVTESRELFCINKGKLKELTLICRCKTFAMVIGNAREECF